MVTLCPAVFHLTGLDEGMELFLPILQSHPHVRRAVRDPEKVVIISKTLPLIEGSDGAKHPVVALEADGSIDLPGDPRGHGIEEILFHFSKLEVVLKRERERLRLCHLVGLGRRPGTTGKDETKGSQRDSHDACIKRDERLGVNRAAFASRRRSSYFPP